MNSFFNILQTITNVEVKRYPNEPFVLISTPFCKINAIQNHAHYLINSIFNLKNNNENCLFKCNANAKFTALNRIIENSFNKDELKEEIMELFSKAQKYYYAFSRLAHLYRLRKYQYIVTDDLSMNPLDIKHSNTFVLIENKSNYLFSLHDLISIIENAITHSPSFFSDPLWPVNPYNKQPFTIATLYNIYFTMKKSTRLMSVLFHLFFLEKFNLTVFSEKYEANVREHAIKKFVFNSPYEELHPAVLTMLKQNTFTKLLPIDKEFPKDILVNIFRPFLFYYYIVNYDIQGTSKIYNYKQILHQKFKKFYEFNKIFGRKYIKLTTNSKNRIIKKEYKFNTNHISFDKISVNINNDLFVVGVSQTIHFFSEGSSSSEDDYEDNEDDEDDDEDNDGVQPLNLSLVDRYYEEEEEDGDELDDNLSIS